MHAFKNPEVAKVFAVYPQSLRDKLTAIRELIFRTAAKIPQVGPLEETLKWGQPSYLTSETGTGSTIRLGLIPGRPGDYGVFFHCQTTLVHGFREKFGARFRYEGNRCLVFSDRDTVPTRELSECIAQALTYHAQRRRTRQPIRQRIR